MGARNESEGHRGSAFASSGRHGGDRVTGDRQLRVGLAITAVVAHLERGHGQARLLVADERRQVAEGLGVFHKCAVIDCGNGHIATVGPRGGGLRIHDLRSTGTEHAHDPT